MGAIVIIQPIKWRRKLKLTVRGGKAVQMEVSHQVFSKDFDFKSNNFKVKGVNLIH